MSPQVKRSVLALATFATATAAWYAPAPEAEVDGITLSARAQQAKPLGPGSTAASAPSKGMIETPVLSIRSRQRDEPLDSELFSPTQWTKPVQRVEVVAPVPARSASLSTQAPALPFVVLGRYEDAGQTAVFLQHNEQNLVVRVGDTIAGDYKVESLKGSTLNLRYLPLNQPQSLEVGGSQ